MKIRFSTFDIACVIAELQRYVGMRVNNIYDIDNKSYLIKLQRSEEKCIILFESGTRLHTTGFEWPKNIAPSGFSMKMRKHLKNKRLENISQLGTDRIVDLQFGSSEAAYHVIIEMYDRGNVLLTDYEFTILNVLRPHTEGDKVKFAVREKYPQNRAREIQEFTAERIAELLQSAKANDQLKKVLVSNSDYGPAIIEHVLLKEGFSNSTKIGKNIKVPEDVGKIVHAMVEAEDIFKSAKTQSKGYIIQKKEERLLTETNQTPYFYSNQEFHPILFQQHINLPYKEFDSFNTAIDEFYSTAEGQKIELKSLQQEREAMKKLENVRKDHDQRLVALEKTQEIDKQKAELITRNQELVERAILVLQTALANQVSWADIDDYIKDAAAKGDPIAQQIKQLKLEMNHFTLLLNDPYLDDPIPAMTVDIDLALSAYANARRFYDQKRTAAKKQQKTIESQSKALKSAERKTKQTLKEVQSITNINKARKTFWFEKFYWFISSENYLIIAGRDQQQNELIVKRYMKPTDVYVHADIHGASSVIIKNPTGQAVPPKSTNEAGTMAICYSVAWEAKVVTNAYWVWGEQVSKTAPTGEYLTTGSFMIRGKKNFLPPSHLILGLSFLFKLEDASVERHKDERKIVGVEDGLEVVEVKDEVEIELLDDSDEEEKLEKVVEETEVASDSESESNYPDTHIKIQHFAGTKVNIVSVPIDISQEKQPDENIFYLGDDKPVVMKSVARSRGNSESKGKHTLPIIDPTKDLTKQQPHSKRGQKSKLKKIKEKYKDQDEEERKLRMEILQSSGLPKEIKKHKKSKDNAKGDKPKVTKPVQPNRAPKPEIDGVDDEEQQAQVDIDVIDTLTGTPIEEDELLFAIPVIAPYNTLANYKFKVKLTPGTAKRGKAARTAVAMFLKDRASTQREKDLLKAVKDEVLVRNLPGKVKLSAPKLQTLKK